MGGSVPNRFTLGSVLRAFREKRGLSQEALAAVAKLHRTYIGGVERGERNPSFESISRILYSLEVTWTDLGRAMDHEGGGTAK